MRARSSVVGGGWMAAIGLVAAACGGGDTASTAASAAASTVVTTAGDDGSGATTVPATATAPPTTVVVATTAAPVTAVTTAAPTTAPATTAAPTGGVDALIGLWFFECEEYIPGDGATSGVLDIQLTGPSQITVDIQGYRYLTPDCSDEPAEDAANLLVFDVLDATEGPSGTEYAVTETSSGFSDSLSLDGDGVLTVDGDRLTRSVDFNTAYD